MGSTYSENNLSLNTDLRYTRAISNTLLYTWVVVDLILTVLTKTTELLNLSTSYIVECSTCISCMPVYFE